MISCENYINSTPFIEATQGRYLFNSNEIIEVKFKSGQMLIKWRNQDLEPVRLTDSSFYLSKMNEKLIFVSKPKMHIELAPKREHKGKKFIFPKLKDGEKIPCEHFKDKAYEKALAGYIAIQKKDSLDQNIRQRTLKTIGYSYLQKKQFEEAKEIFKINIALYPKSSDVYYCMGNAYKAEKDTVKALEYFKKSLDINPENRSSKRKVEQLTKEE